MTGRLARRDDGAVLIERLHFARTRAERTRGLLRRDTLADDEAMWFPRCRLIHTFGMQFSLDLVYVNKGGEVCKIVRGLRPGRLSACLGASGVIELNAGGADRLGLRCGTALNVLEPPTL